MQNSKEIFKTMSNPRLKNIDFKFVDEKIKFVGFDYKDTYFYERKTEEVVFEVTRTCLFEPKGSLELSVTYAIELTLNSEEKISDSEINEEITSNFKAIVNDIMGKISHTIAHIMNELSGVPMITPPIYSFEEE